MTYIAGRWKIAAVLVVSLLLTGLACVGISRAQIKKDDVDFEILATVTMVKGDTLWELAQKYYDDPYRWGKIMEMNKIPDERRIPIGTVIYIPVEDAKRIVKEVEKQIEEKKVVVKDTSAELEKLQAEIKGLRAKLKKCQAENKRLAKALRECRAKNKKLTAALEEKNAMIKAKDATIAEMQAMLADIKAAVDKIKEESDLAIQEQRRRTAAQAEKDELIEELEAKVRRQRREIAELEEARDKLKARIAEAERNAQSRRGPARRRQPPEPAKKEIADPRARAAALAIGLLGAVLWIFSE